VVPDPAVNGGTITIPPGGAVAGVFARTDATSGVYQSPAGVTASVSNALNVDAKFSDALLGDLNSINVNVLRPVAGQGICIMGGRTRKNFGVDRYINARRTLIYVKETLRNSTQFALFQNNNEALWADLYATADRVLRPIWNSGGLRGTSTNEAYFIVCDETINTPDVIASGEVRMEIGLALEYPAEFIVIRVSQFDGGRSTAEIIS
jgi:phage tail sheath protein FI